MVSKVISKARKPCCIEFSSIYGHFYRIEGGGCGIEIIVGGYQRSYKEKILFFIQILQGLLLL